MNAQAILQKIARALQCLESPVRASVPREPPVHAKLQDSLSGALGCKVQVKEGLDGGLFALVPVHVLKSSGLTVQRSIVPGASPVLVGESSSIANAERRIAKRLGDSWKASLVEYEPHYALAVFLLDALDA